MRNELVEVETEQQEKVGFFTKVKTGAKAAAEKVKSSKVTKVVIGAALVTAGAIAGAACVAKANKENNDDLDVIDLDDYEVVESEPEETQE